MKPLVPTAVPFLARRSMAAAAYGRQMYFFGGVGAAGTESILDVSNDLWSFDSADLTWNQIPFTVPWPSARRCAGWTSHGNSLVLWGGSGICEEPQGTVRHTFLNDFWRFELGECKWKLLRYSDDYRHAPLSACHYPFPRYTPVFQSVGSHLFVFGGYTEDRLGKRKLNDAWIWTGDNNEEWSRIPSREKAGYAGDARWPGVRYGSMSAGDDQHVYICGGFSDEGDHIDVWRFDVAKLNWQMLFPDGGRDQAPEPRYCAAFAIKDNRLYLFGGRSRRNPKLNFNDLWSFHLDKRTWELIHGHRGPYHYDQRADYPAYHAKSASAIVGTCWYIWGGEGERGHVSDFWRLDLTDSVWQLIQSARGDDPIFW